MTRLHEQSHVGDWVVAHPQTSRVFESLKIDYCCGGNIPLAEACRRRQLNPSDVMAQLEESIKAAPASDRDWREVSMAELCHHIEQTHHAYLKQELPRLTEMIAKVVQAHGKSHPDLTQLADVFAELRGELEPHMFKEERILFPAIRQLEQAAEAVAFPFGTVANPIHMMEHEHDVAGRCLTRIREITHDFTVPEDACNTYRAMLDALERLEYDLHQHIHKENNILFPRAIETESHRKQA